MLQEQPIFPEPGQEFPIPHSFEECETRLHKATETLEANKENLPNNPNLSNGRAFTELMTLSRYGNLIDFFDEYLAEDDSDPVAFRINELVEKFLSRTMTHEEEHELANAFWEFCQKQLKK